MLMAGIAVDDVACANLLISPVKREVSLNRIRDVISVAKGTVVDILVYKISSVKVRKISHVL